uniref:Uncharacterized protein n=1 Tax=Kalanchoe fedtschenkoi TaxID=63787 RepID=A0A7N0RDE8_KALFE
MSISQACLTASSSAPRPANHTRLRLSTASRSGVGAFAAGRTLRLSTSAIQVQKCEIRWLGFRGGVRFFRKLGSCVKAESGVGAGGTGDDEWRGESTMPERFRYLTKEAPDPPLRWPWFVALAVLAYAWRTVLFELSNWRRNAVGIFHLLGYVGKLALALIFHFIGHPITSTIRFAENIFYTVRAFYSSIVAYAPVAELILIIILSSLTLSIAEAAVPDAVSSQQHILTISGFIGYFALRGFISEPFFWTLLVGIYAFSRFVKKRDEVSAALPAAAVMAAIGEPWVRLVVLASFIALAVTHHSSELNKGKVADTEASEAKTTVPLPLLGVALAIGVRLAAKWAGYRHLTWMIV